MTEIIIISIVCATAAAVGVCIGVLKYYKRGLHAPIYPLEHYTKMDLTHSSDRFLHRHVTRVKVASSKKDD
jgi:hypothetical protein